MVICRSPRGDQEILELLLSPERRGSRPEVFDDNARSMVNRKAVRAVRLHCRQLPSYHLGSGHEEVDHACASGKLDASTRFASLHTVAHELCAVKVQSVHVR